MTRPTTYLIRMVVFLVAVLVVADLGLVEVVAAESALSAL